LGADEDDVVEDAGVITERLFPIGTGANIGTTLGSISSLFFLRPPNTRFNLDPALPGATGMVGDGGGTGC